MRHKTHDHSFIDNRYNFNIGHTAETSEIRLATVEERSGSKRGIRANQCWIHICANNKEGTRYKREVARDQSETALLLTESTRDHCWHLGAWNLLVAKYSHQSDQQCVRSNIEPVSDRSEPNRLRKSHPLWLSENHFELSWQEPVDRRALERPLGAIWSPAHRCVGRLKDASVLWRMVQHAHYRQTAPRFHHSKQS